MLGSVGQINSRQHSPCRFSWNSVETQLNILYKKTLWSKQRTLTGSLFPRLVETLLIVDVKQVELLEPDRQGWMLTSNRSASGYSGGQLLLLILIASSVISRFGIESAAA